MDDPAYKQLFSRPRMVEDLLHGFAARDWSGALDFASLAPLPASYVSHDLRQRHGDLVWRVRFHDERWLYLVLHLEFQSTVDRAMAVRMLAYTTLLYQKLIGEGVLREHDALPPVLPIVIYNGRRRWNAAADVSELIAAGGAALARYQPSQRYFLLDEGRVGDADLPDGNLVSALIALETSRDRERLPELLGSLIGLLREQGDEELTQAFRSWVAQVLLPRRFRGGESGWLPRLEEVRTMLAEQVREWTEEWVEEGREQGSRAASRGSRRAAPKNGRCCAGRRSGSSTPPQRAGWPPRWRTLPTRAGWRRLATGSSSAGRRPICSAAYRMSVDAAYEVNRALCAGGDACGAIAAAHCMPALCWHPRSISIPTCSGATPVAQPVPGVIESGARSR